MSASGLKVTDNYMARFKEIADEQITMLRRKLNSGNINYYPHELNNLHANIGYTSLYNIMGLIDLHQNCSQIEKENPMYKFNNLLAKCILQILRKSITEKIIVGAWRVP